jgi:hypothetical protein
LFAVAVHLPNSWEDVMEYKTLDKLRDVAEIAPNWLGARPLSRAERLEYWAEALEGKGDRRLTTLFDLRSSTNRPPSGQLCARTIRC